MNEKKNITDNPKQPDESFLSGTVASYVPFYDDGQIRIYNDKAEQLLQGFAPGSYDAIITDPPYNTTVCAWDTEIDLDYYFEQWGRLLKANGVLVVFADEPFTSLLITKKLEWFKYRVTWDKQQGSGFLNAKKMPLKQTEDYCVFSKVTMGNFTYNPQIKDKNPLNIRPIGNRKPVQKTTYNEHNGKYSEDYDNTKSYPTNLISINGKIAECNSTRRLHPTQKPEKLLMDIILTYTNEGDRILDNFMGSGTTLTVAKKLGRKSDGIEQDPIFCTIAAERCKQEQLFN